MTTVRSSWAPRSDYGAAHAVEIARHEAEAGCRELFARMLYAGQHRIAYADAVAYAANLGLDRFRVKDGRVI